jgi:TPR repeat protein
VKWFKKSADQGNSSAQYNLGNCYYYGDGVKISDKKAVKYYKLSADQGDRYAQYNLANCYVKGEGVEKDLTKAASYFKESADQGYYLAMSQVGFYYFHGKGVKQDIKIAKKYLEMSLDQRGEWSLQIHQLYITQKWSYTLGSRKACYHQKELCLRVLAVTKKESNKLLPELWNYIIQQLLCWEIKQISVQQSCQQPDSNNNKTRIVIIKS